MASWNSANLAAMFPPIGTTIISIIDGLLAVVEVPLNLISSALTIAENVIITLNLFDFLGDLKEYIIEFKLSITGSGFFVCGMWDYPVRQLVGDVKVTAESEFSGYVDEITYQYTAGNIPDWAQKLRDQLPREVTVPNVGFGTRTLTERTYQLTAKKYVPDRLGPDSIYGMVNLKGHYFKSSFLAELDSSFDDTNDPYRPQFEASCALFVIVKAGTTPESIGVSTDEDNVSSPFGGFGAMMHSAAKSIRAKRMRALFYKMKLAAEKKEADKVAARVERIQRTIDYYNTLTNEELDAIVYPQDEVTGVMFNEDLTPERLSWDLHIVPVLQSVESLMVSTKYPGWSRVTIQDLIPAMQDLVDYVFDPVIDLLQSGSAIKQSIIDLIKAINGKLAYLQELIAAINDIMSEINKLLNATGFHALYVSTNNGVTDLRSKLLKADNVPFHGKYFYAGMAIAAGSDAKPIFDLLFSAVTKS